MESAESRLTVAQIKERFPNQYVGLTDIQYVAGGNAVESAVVKCTENDTPYDEMCLLAIRGEIYMHYTMLENDPFMNVVEG